MSESAAPPATERRARPARSRAGRGAPRPIPGGPVEAPPPERLRAVLEALAFATEEPLTLDDLADLFPGVERARLEEAVDGLERACEEADRGLRLIRVAGGRRLATKSELSEWVRALFRSRNRRRLTTQALETLALIAYRQPITTPEIQAIRGSDPSTVLEGLLDKQLIRILGRKKVVGKPVLYGTTREFLAHFGLNSLEELPDLEEFGGFGAAAQGARPTDPGGGGDGAAAAAIPAVGGEAAGVGGGDDADDENRRGDDRNDS